MPWDRDMQQSIFKKNIHSKIDTREQAAPLFGRLAKYVPGITATLAEGLGTGTEDGC